MRGDATEFLMTGATAVAVGTANLYEPQTALQVIGGIREFMRRRGLQDVREIVGSMQARRRHPAEPGPGVPAPSG